MLPRLLGGRPRTPSPWPQPCSQRSAPTPATRPRTLAGQVQLGTTLREAVLAQAPSSTSYRRGTGLQLWSGDGRGCPSSAEPWLHTFLSPGQTPSTLPLAALSRSTLSRAGRSYFKSSMWVSSRDIQAHEPHCQGGPSVCGHSPAHGHLLRFPGQGPLSTDLTERSL